MERTNTGSVINFIYFTSNFQYDFIERAFNPNIAAHLRSKFDGIISRSGDGYCSLQSFMKFMFELDVENKRILIDWIDENYNCGMI